MNLIAFLFFALTLVVIPHNAGAHGGASLTLTSTTTEGYIVDVDVTDGILQADSFTRMNFGLFTDGERKQQVNFTDMWIRIIQTDGGTMKKTLFAGPVAKSEFGGDGFSFVFPKGGMYTLSIRYNDATKERFGTTVAEAQFSLDVLRSTVEDKFNFTSNEYLVGIGTGAFLAIIGLLPLLIRRKEI